MPEENKHGNCGGNSAKFDILKEVRDAHLRSFLHKRGASCCNTRKEKIQTAHPQHRGAQH